MYIKNVKSIFGGRHRKIVIFGIIKNIRKIKIFCSITNLTENNLTKFTQSWWNYNLFLVRLKLWSHISRNCGNIACPIPFSDCILSLSNTQKLDATVKNRFQILILHLKNMYLKNTPFLCKFTRKITIIFITQRLGTTTRDGFQILILQPKVPSIRKKPFSDDHLPKYHQMWRWSLYTNLFKTPNAIEYFIEL